MQPAREIAARLARSCWRRPACRARRRGAGDPRARRRCRRDRVARATRIAIGRPADAESRRVGRRQAEDASRPAPSARSRPARPCRGSRRGRTAKRHVVHAGRAARQSAHFQRHVAERHRPLRESTAASSRPTISADRARRAIELGRAAASPTVCAVAQHGDAVGDAEHLRRAGARCRRCRRPRARRRAMTREQPLDLAARSATPSARPS